MAYHPKAKCMGTHLIYIFSSLACHCRFLQIIKYAVEKRKAKNTQIWEYNGL